MSKIFLATNDNLLKKQAALIIQDIPGAIFLPICANGNEAIRACYAEQPEICLVDLFLPPTTGLDLIRKIRDIKMDKAPQIVLLSHLRNRTILERALRLGANDVLAHPYSLDELKQTILHYAN